MTNSARFIKPIEDGLLAQVTAAFTKPGDQHPWLKVEAWPTRPEGYRLTAAGDIFVIYKGGTYQVRATGEQFYEDALKFEIVLRARTLRDHDGAYEMLETIRDAVCGRRLPQSADVTVPLRDDFADYGEGVFAYALLVSVPVLIVQGRDRGTGPYLQSPVGGRIGSIYFTNTASADTPPALSGTLPPKTP
ncbi:MAG: Gp37 family protein [Burkholderia sp.]